MNVLSSRTYVHVLVGQPVNLPLISKYILMSSFQNAALDLYMTVIDLLFHQLHCFQFFTNINYVYTFLAYTSLYLTTSLGYRTEVVC